MLFLLRLCLFQVDLNREITFCHSKRKFNGVPIMASNMDTVGTFEMAVALAEVCPVSLLENKCAS